MPLKPHRLSLLLTLVISTVTGTAHAAIALNEAIIDFWHGQPTRTDITVSNLADEPAYVSVEPVEVLRPGTTDEQRVSEPDPARRGLLVTPSRLIIEPRQKRLVRFALLNPPQQERIYRVLIRPVSAGATLGEERFSVQVLVGYEVLVIARPKDAEPKVVAEREASRLKLRNDGNTNLLLVEGRQCDVSGGECVELPAKRLYPGTSWEVPLSYDTPVHYRGQLGESYRDLEF